MNYFIDIGQFKEDIESGYDYSEFLLDDNKRYRVQFARQKTGYGFKHFLICPKCGSRRTKLYEHHDQYICRYCYPYNIYRFIQNAPKGGYRYIAYRMKRYADSHGVELYQGPFNYARYEKPVHRKGSSWADNLTVLQALENMRFQALAYRKRWSLKTVNSVLTWNNSLLYLFDLDELLNYRNVIQWDKGVDMNTDFMRKDKVNV